MKKNTLQIFAAALLAIATVVGYGTSTKAVVITDEQSSIIRNSCTEVRSSLIRLEQNDKLLRTNRGQLYKTISDKLMVPLNQRLTSNQLDGGELVKTAASYNDAYQAFYEAYQQYDTTMAKAIDTDCVNSPTDFFNNIAAARENRTVLHEANERLVELAEQYSDEFSSFSDKFQKENP